MSRRLSPLGKRAQISQIGETLNVHREGEEERRRRRVRRRRRRAGIPVCLIDGVLGGGQLGSHDGDRF